MDRSGHLIIWTKRKELEALEQSHMGSPIDGYYDYWQGKAAAFADMWQYLVFDGREPHPKKYNEQNEYWCDVIKAIAELDAQDGYILD